MHLLWSVGIPFFLHNCYCVKFILESSYRSVVYRIWVLIFYCSIAWYFMNMLCCFATAVFLTWVPSLNYIPYLYMSSSICNWTITPKCLNVFFRHIYGWATLANTGSQFLLDDINTSSKLFTKLDVSNILHCP